MSRNHGKQSVYLPIDLRLELDLEAARLGRCASSMLQEAWRIYRSEPRPIVPKRAARTVNRVRVTPGESWTGPSVDLPLPSPERTCPTCHLKCVSQRGLSIHLAVHTGRKTRTLHGGYGDGGPSLLSVEEFLRPMREAWEKRERMLKGSHCGVWPVQVSP
jgi:hypothetical protein